MSLTEGSVFGLVGEKVFGFMFLKELDLLGPVFLINVSMVFDVVTGLSDPNVQSFHILVKDFFKTTFEKVRTLFTNFFRTFCTILEEIIFLLVKD